MKTKLLWIFAGLSGAVMVSAHAQTEGGGTGTAGGGSLSPGGSVAAGTTASGQALAQPPVAPVGLTPAGADVPPSTPTNAAVPSLSTVIPAPGTAPVSDPALAPSSAVATPSQVDPTGSLFADPSRAAWSAASPTSSSAADPTVPAGTTATNSFPTAGRSAIMTPTPGSVAPMAGSPSPRPGVSPGTTPIGPQPLVSATGGPAASSSPESATRAGVDRAADDGAAPLTAPQPGVATTVVVTTPPPPAPAETMTTPTARDQTWVPGHYTLQDGQWQWVAGQWAVPPTPNAVWIPGRYDDQTQRWTEGHWDTTSAPSPRRSTGR